MGNHRGCTVAASSSLWPQPGSDNVGLVIGGASCASGKEGEADGGRDWVLVSSVLQGKHSTVAVGFIMVPAETQRTLAAL